MSKQTKTKTNSKTYYGRFVDSVKAGEVKHIPLCYHEHKPPFWMTLNEIEAIYGNKLSGKTMKLYIVQGLFPHPVALMLTKGAPSWLYSAREIAEYFAGKREFSQEKYDEMVERSKKLQAKGARLRYKADKMRKRFIVDTVSEVK